MRLLLIPKLRGDTLFGSLELLLAAQFVRLGLASVAILDASLGLLAHERLDAFLLLQSELFDPLLLLHLHLKLLIFQEALDQLLVPIFTVKNFFFLHQQCFLFALGEMTLEQLSLEV